VHLTVSQSIHTATPHTGTPTSVRAKRRVKGDHARAYRPIETDPSCRTARGETREKSHPLLLDEGRGGLTHEALQHAQLRAHADQHVVDERPIVLDVVRACEIGPGLVEAEAEGTHAHDSGRVTREQMRRPSWTVLEVRTLVYAFQT